MLKRESERLVEPLPGFPPPPANSTCIVVVLFIVWKFLWFFLKCAVHISLTELIKGNECFKSTSAFLIYRNQTPGVFLRSVHIVHSLSFSFPWISLPFSLLFHIHGWISASGSRVPSVLYVVSLQMAKEEVVIFVVRNDLRLYPIDKLWFSMRPWKVCVVKYKPSPLVSNPLYIQLRNSLYCGWNE